MGIRHESLDAAVRGAMVAELERDQGEGRLYISPRLTEEGAFAWPALLEKAAEQHDDVWLAETLRGRGLLRTVMQRRRVRGGGFTMAKVPRNAPETLAEWEFNRLYARAACVVALASGETEVEVYRGKQVETPRPESLAMIGVRVSPEGLLIDLRASQGVEPALRLPPGPNSGLTIRRVQLTTTFRSGANDGTAAR